MADFTTHIAETIQCVVRQFPQVLDTFRFAQHDIECSAGCCRSGWSITCTEYVRTGVVSQIVDRFLVRSDETADRSKRLAECTHDQIHIVRYAEVVAGPATVIAQDT